MDRVLPSVGWDEAVRGYLIHLKAVRAKRTVLFYQGRLKCLARWAQDADIPIARFGKRHLDEYLVSRAEAGIGQTTLHHDALAAKVFLKWCVRNDIIGRSLLADYEVRTAPKPAKYMPTEEDMRSLLDALHTFWDPEQNPESRYCSPDKRSFHRDRNYAVVMLLLDSACRIGEVLGLTLDDYQASARQILVRKSKGREPRAIPVSRDCAEAIAEWLKIRARTMESVRKEDDEGWLFISETGTQIDGGRFLKTLKRITDSVGLTRQITLHSLRRFSLNRLSKHNLLAAQAIAGHKDPRTTLIYTRIDPDFVRAMHDQVGVVRGILGSKRAEKRKRLVR